MCCLMFEHEFYRDTMKKFPKISSKVITPSGQGKIVDINVFMEKIIVEHEDGKRLPYKLNEIKTTHSSKSVKEDNKEDNNEKKIIMVTTKMK